MPSDVFSEAQKDLSLKWLKILCNWQQFLSLLTLISKLIRGLFVVLLE